MGCIIDGRRCNGCDGDAEVERFINLYNNRVIRLRYVKAREKVRGQLLEGLRKRIEDLKFEI